MPVRVVYAGVLWCVSLLVILLQAPVGAGAQNWLPDGMGMGILLTPLSEKKTLVTVAPSGSATVSSLWHTSSLLTFSIE